MYQELNYGGSAAITTSDTAPNVYRAIYVGGAGNLAVVLEGDTNPVTLTGVLVGTILPLRTKRVMATNTTATLLIGLS